MNNIKKKKKPVNRYKVIVIVMFIVFMAIIARLIYLQVFKYDDYKDKANTRARRFIAEQAPRGKIYDNTGMVLATNKQTYTLTFTETEESKKQFYKTIDTVYKMLEEHGEKIQDKFQLKLNENNEFYFDFNLPGEEDRKRAELRFKKDRGMDESIKKKLFPKKEGELTTEESDEVDDELMKITPYETFEYLVKLYNMYDLLNPNSGQAKEYSNLKPEEITKLILEKYNLNDIRRYMVIKDAIKIQSFSGSKAITIAPEIKEETAFIFYQKLNDLPGVDVAQTPIRYYPNNNLASSIIGYVSSINSDNKEKYESRGYDVSTDSIGRAGIEAAFESDLKGSKGGTTVNVNSAGRKQSELFSLETYPGNDVHLTIDKNIQYSAEKSLEHTLKSLQKAGQIEGVNTSKATRGAAVAIDVNTGRVLALASYPDYDPNIFSHGELTPEQSKQYFNPDLEAFGKDLIARQGLKKSVDDLFPKNKNGQRDDKYDLYPKPFYNYATMGLIPPGSTFKPMTAVVGLEEGVITPETTIYANGSNYDKHPEIFGKGTPPKDKNFGPGYANLGTALKKSSNTYFFDTAVQLYYKYNKSLEGLDTIAKYAWKFGLGVNPNSSEKAGTGIEIAENFGNTYNFESFKKQNVYYARYKLVDILEKGVSPRGGKFPAVVNIGENPSDDKNLAKAKTNLKKIITDQINLIGVQDITGDIEKFSGEIREALQNLYNVSPAYKKSIDDYIANVDNKMTVDRAMKITADELAIWVIYDMKREITTPVELANASIGQGMNAYSPVQIANYIATLANGGTRYKVHLVDKITDPDGNTIKEFKPEVVEKTGISEKTVDAIKDGMYKVNHEGNTSISRAGSGYQTFGNFPIATCGKTGTATFRNDQSENGREDFGVYVAFAPKDNPQIAVAVAIYDGGHGYFGAQIAKCIFETYFRDQLKAMGYATPRYYLGNEAYDYTLNPPLDNQNNENNNEQTKEVKK